MARPDRPADRLPGGAELPLSGVDTRLADGPDPYATRYQREEGGEEEGACEGHVLGEPAPCYSHHNGGGRDGGPLDRLERPGERQPLAVLHHHGIREDVAEGEAEPHEGKVERHLPIGIGVQTTEEASHHRRQPGGQQKVAPAPPPKQRDKVGEEPVHRLDQPGNDRDREEISGLPGTEVPRLFQQKGEREVRQVPHALGEVDHGKDEHQAARFGVLPEAPEYRGEHHGESPKQETVGHSPSTGSPGNTSVNAFRSMYHTLERVKAAPRKFEL